MIVCDMCKTKKALQVLTLGEGIPYCWCGDAECRKKLLVELNTVLEASEHRVRAALYEPDKKNE